MELSISDLDDPRTEASAPFLHSVLDSLPTSVAVLDRGGRIVYVNARWRQFGAAGGADPATTGVGADYFLACRNATEPAAEVEAGLSAVLAGTSPEFRRDYPCTDPDGSTRWFTMAAVPWSGPDAGPGAGPEAGAGAGPGAGAGAGAGIAGVVVTHQDITVRKQVESSALREQHLLRTAIRVQREITAVSRDRDVTLQLVADLAVEVFPAADGAVVELVDGDELVYGATAGTLAPFARLRIARDGSLSGLAIMTNSSMRCDDSETDPRVDRAACRRVGTASMLVVPMAANDEVIGVLKVSSRRAAAFDDIDVHQLELLAGSLTSALRHAEDLHRNNRLLAERTDVLAALADSEQRFRLAFDNSPLGMCLTTLETDRFGRFLQANAAMAAITGYEIEDLLELSFHDLQHPDDLAESVEMVQGILRGEIDGGTVERRYRCRDGQVIWVRLCTAAVRDAGGSALYVVTQLEDITTSRYAQVQLEQQASLLALTPAAVIVRDLDGTIRGWNRGAESTYGWPAAAARGRRIHRLLVTRFGPAGEQAQVAELLEKGSWTGELAHRRADGPTLTVLSRQALQRDREGRPIAVLEINTDITQQRAAELALAESEQRFRAQFAHSAIGQLIRGLDAPLQDINPALAAMLGGSVTELAGIDIYQRFDPEDRALIMQHLATVFVGDCDAFHIETRLLRLDDDWLDVHLTASVVRDPDGSPKYLVGLVYDISDRKRAEHARDVAAEELAEHNELLERANAELAEANQFKTDLMGMLSHEIGTPLTSIVGRTELLLERSGPGSQERTYLEVVMRNARALVELRDEILTMVAGDTGRLRVEHEPVDVATAVQHALVAVEQDVPVVGTPGLTVLTSGAHLQQILVNLLTNAAKYAGGATAIEVREAGDDVLISVRDAGPGIPPELGARLFQRFSRGIDDTSRERGTGLGLFIVRTLAEASNGAVWHEPAVPTGSVFTLRLLRAH